MAQVIRWRLFKAEACVRSKASICVIFGRQRHNGIGISPSTSVFPFQYYSIEAQSFFITGAINLSKQRASLHTH